MLAPSVKIAATSRSPEEALYGLERSSVENLKTLDPGPTRASSINAGGPHIGFTPGPCPTPLAALQGPLLHFLNF
jgi:hypothetical protein